MNTNALRAICTLFLLLAACAFFYTNKQQQHYQSHALPALKQMLTDIAQWDKSALTKHLSTQALHTIDNQQLDQLLDHYRQYGALNTFGELHFSKLVSLFSLFGEKRINFSGSVQFDSGNAHLNITLVEDIAADKTIAYKIYNFSLRR